MTQINKKDVIGLLEKIALYLELKGENPFKISAYRKAAQALETDNRSLSEIDDFTALNGIGKGTAAVIDEYIQRGSSDTLFNLEQEIPAGLIPLLNLPGLGGKKLAKLYQELNVIDADTLREACTIGKVAELKGFGKKTSEKIVKALDEVNSQPDRLPIAMMLPIVEKLEAYLKEINAVLRYSRAGSIRRMRETVKDLDFIIASDHPHQVRDELLAITNIKEIIASGDTKVSIVLEESYDVSVDFRIVKLEEFATTLHHFTGSKDHNVAMRQRAKAQNEKISEYGVENNDTGEVITFDTEAAFFQHFGLSYIPPELRENAGELEAFEREVSLIEPSDIKGDLHMHTTWSDGAQSIEEMVKAALEKGYHYIAITDHSKFLKVANGLNETRLLEQRKEIERLKQKYPAIHIFAGVEMDILPNGSLDFDNTFLKEMDYVIGAIHSSFNQTEEEIMKRLYHACDNPYVTIIAHPTGRIIGRRKGYKANVKQLIQRAKETGTVLELNANPNRFDLAPEWLRLAQDQGVKIAINTDAHNEGSLDYMNDGVLMAKRGWLEKDTVINTWTKEQVIDLFQSKR
ncbi:DNA polymerase/3'-5' exonuclease PolX [Paraliobacillus sp. PM-2]|uniref:DNA polymerase/3'-5' exonuclease PolX n=1 Tax=Paraliobacillus sp. PM-2 TaxID=1462524 RepID=UPI00061BD7B1|nr:DNA polymerase/3'-5' exonuclease PolX [Paraliobacillus sp. PM-2]CQR48073.1 DNA polymerase/3'-5' exonuclease PolX [Paraliobacillus sp. PM-2]